MEDKKKSIKNLAFSIKGSASQYISENLEKSEVSAFISEKAKLAAKSVKESKVTKKAVDIHNYTSDKLDTVSGKKLLELVDERLQLQAEYNDLMASKIVELLNRVETLEKENEKFRLLLLNPASSIGE